MGANEPRGVVNFDPRGMVGRIYVGDHLTLLHTKYLSAGLMASEKIFEVFLIISLWEIMSIGAWPIWTPGHDWQDL